MLSGTSGFRFLKHTVTDAVDDEASLLFPLYKTGMAKNTQVVRDRHDF